MPCTLDGPLELVTKVQDQRADLSLLHRSSAEISSKQVTEELPDEKLEYEGPPTPDTANGARHDLKAEASPEPEFELVVQPTVSAADDWESL